MTYIDAVREGIKGGMIRRPTWDKNAFLYVEKGYVMQSWGGMCWLDRDDVYKRDWYVEHNMVKAK